MEGIIADLAGGIRQQTLRRLITLAWLLRSAYETGIEWKEWFENEMSIQDIQKIIPCSDRTAWDYMQSLKKIADVFW